MAKYYEKVTLKDRKYPGHFYRIVGYPVTGKISVLTSEPDSFAWLKMSRQEAEELIVRLQFALYEMEN